MKKMLFPLIEAHDDSINEQLPQRFPPEISSTQQIAQQFVEAFFQAVKIESNLKLKSQSIYIHAVIAMF